ncbi:MAG: phosphoenolpyruvate carboxylase, partial [Comamonas sp.]
MNAAARRRSESPTAAAPVRRTDKDLPLIDDIRLLGRLLGDVIREQEGAPAYELVEQVRQLSVAFRRNEDQAADKTLKKLLKGLTGDQTVSVIRAFTYFSHLANLAEDRHHIRRREVHERAGHSQEGSVEVALSRIRWEGIETDTVVQALAEAYVAPVLTAHPTEVQRQSILAAEHDIARLLAERDLIRARAQLYASSKDALSPKELAQNEEQLKARVVQLWQTRLLRHAKLTVADEIENSLRYYEATFLREIPRIYREMEQQLDGKRIHSFLRMGQWIGGDRDGNPNVTAETLALALRRQSEVALRHYLTEVHFLGTELSMAARLAEVSPAMQQLADASPDRNAHREDEPYRRALTGMYARLAATLRKLSGGEAARHAVAPQNPYDTPQELLADLRTIEDSLIQHHGAALAALRLSPLIRAVEVFGFHLATVDLRQSSDQHELVVAELLAVAKIEADYSALDEAQRQQLLLRMLSDARPLRVVGVEYSAHSRSELAIFETARQARTDYGAEALRHCIISHTESVSDLLEVLLLMKEVGLMRGTLDSSEAVADMVVVPLFETIGDLRQA